MDTPPSKPYSKNHDDSRSKTAPRTGKAGVETTMVEAREVGKARHKTPRTPQPLATGQFNPGFRSWARASLRQTLFLNSGNLKLHFYSHDRRTKSEDSAFIVRTTHEEVDQDAYDVVVFWSTHYELETSNFRYNIVQTVTQNFDH